MLRFSHGVEFKPDPRGWVSGVGGAVVGVAAPVRLNIIVQIYTCNFKQVRTKAEEDCRSRQKLVEGEPPT